MAGLCECGCGQPTPICQYNLRTRGYFKGLPLRFIPGHQGRLTTWTDERRRAFRAKMLGHAVHAETREKISRRHRALGIRPSAEAIRKGNENRPTREKSPSWKNGRSFINGYSCIYSPNHPRAYANGYVYEHMLIAEKKLGRALTEREVVHHIDGNKRNNGPANLAILDSQADHICVHRQQEDIA